MRDQELNDCFQHAGGRLSHGEAIEALRSRIRQVTGTERLAVDAAVGRVLAERLVAARDVPPHTNSAVDGFAYAARDLAAAGNRLRVIGRSAAGSPFEAAVKSGDAVRIFTGATVPDGLDTVAMQEDCSLDARDACHPIVALPANLKAGSNVRHAGEDIRAGETLLEKGHVLRPQDLAAIASVGLAEVTCCRRLRIAVVSTGDEIIRPGTVPVAGTAMVYDANQPMLRALCGLAGAEVRDSGVWPDDRDAVKQRLAELAPSVDVILTSGGASMGDEDHMSAALAELGKRHFWQIAVKPGRPLMLGQIGQTVVVGLPGNPVAVFVCFLIYVWPMLAALSGAGWREAARMPARTVFDFGKRKPGRREYWRGTYHYGAEGVSVDKFRRDGSGLISGLRAANCLIEIPETAGDIEVGTVVQVIPFPEFGIR